MRVLVMGGTRFFGIGMVKRLVADGHDVTVATRGNAPDPFGDAVNRVFFDHRSAESIRSAFCGKSYDAVIDKIAFSSNDVNRVVENTDFGKYILMSTCGGYNGKYHTGIKECEFDPYSYPLQWGERDANGGKFDYDEGKRQAECAAAHLVAAENTVMVRYPVVMGKNDYTGRLRYYIEHIISGKPMFISNKSLHISYLYEEDAADMFADILTTDISGPVNACAGDGITLNEIIGYTEKKTGKTAVFDKTGDAAPYNGFEVDVSYDTSKAGKYGITFRPHKEWIYDLIDFYVNEIKDE